jgi:integrase
MLSLLNRALLSNESMGNLWTADSIKYLSTEQLKSFLRVIERKRDSALFLLAYRHGLRASEIGLLRVADLDLTHHRITIHRLKRSLSGVHPMQPDEVKAIKAYLRQRSFDSPILFTSERHNPISRRQLDVLMKGYGKQAKIPEDRRHFYVLKHSIATHLLAAGADLAFVRDWLGHASIKNTMIYAQLISPKRDEQARRLFMSAEVV